MKTEALVIILISVIVMLTCTTIHFSEEKKSAMLAVKKADKKYEDMFFKWKNTQAEVNRLKVINTSLKKELSEWQEYKDVKLTAYCPCKECSEQWGKQTKSGNVATEGRTVAVDSNYIELGSQVKINGKTYIAEDVGGGVRGLHIDIYMEDHDEVTEFGVQTADVKVKKGKK